MKTTGKLWISLGLLALISPLGLYLPQKFQAGDAWGEWDNETLKNFVGYVPQGLKKLSALWHPPLPDYTLNGWSEKGLSHLSLTYILSALVGIALCVILAFVLGRVLRKKEP